MLPKKRGARKLREYIKIFTYSELCDLYLMDAKVPVEVPAYQGKLHTKFEENRINHSRDMSEQTFMLFLHFSFLFTQMKKSP